MRFEVPHWDEENEAHIGRHKLDQDVVEEVLFSDDVVIRRTRSTLEYRRYAVLGATEAGLHLAVFVDYLGDGECRVVTARQMTDKERRMFGRR